MSKTDETSLTRRWRAILRRRSEDSGELKHFVPIRPGETERTSWSTAEPALPDRYEIRETDKGRLLRCREAPGIQVSVDRGHSFSEAEARKLGERVILLDGAGQFGPLVDSNRQLFNLDHHQDCVRAFTLASCEQALVMVLQGLELDRGDWTIYANEPDLDTVFAIWILLNHRRVRQLSPRSRDALLPLIRLEGAVDANGPEIGEYCGLPQDLIRQCNQELDRLFAVEAQIKRSGAWSEMDLARFSLEMLGEIDKIVYSSADFLEFSTVDEEYGHVDIGNDRVAVICRDGSGIYEVERRLKNLWGDSLGIVALERDENHYTLRRTASLAGIDLNEAYEKLSLCDPVVDGRPPEKRWGGSDDIGGSPRPQGTGLTPEEIARILQLTYEKPDRWDRPRRIGAAALFSAALAAGTAGLALAWRLLPGSAPRALANALELVLFSAGGVLLSWLLTARLSGRRPWLYGWRRPVGRDWLSLAPLVVLGAVVGGAWVPRHLSSDTESLAASLVALVTVAVALEMWFRGWVHGMLLLDAPVQSVGGRWFVSRACLVSAALYALVTLAASGLWLAGPPISNLGAVLGWLSVLAGALLAGLALGMMRERSLSIWAGAGAQAVAFVLRLILDLS